MNHKKRKKSIFRLFLVPLLVVMLIQSGLMIGTLAISQFTRTLRDYSEGMMYRTVENRRNILESEMVQRWSSVNTKNDKLLEAMSAQLEQDHLTIDQFLQSEDAQNTYLTGVFSQCVDLLRNINATGIFVVLANDQVGDANALCDGIYVRDADPYANSSGLKDLLMERGNKALAREWEITLDMNWATKFQLAPEGKRGEDDYFYKPYTAGLENPEAKTANLGYWSPLFHMEEEKTNSSYKMITYTIPLIYAGTVYGVLGVEISENFLTEFLPLEELNDNYQSGYLLAQDQGDGTWKTVMGTGIFYERLTEHSDEISAVQEDYDSFYRVTSEDDSAYYAVARPMHLYNNNTPFSDQQWIVVGVQSGQQLFGISNQIYYRMAGVLCVGLVFGILCIYFIIRYLTRPIRRLMDSIGGSEEELESFQRSDIEEVDELYDVVKNLTHRQKEAENALIEEKERYRLALESTRDLFFTYDLKTKEMNVFNSEEYAGGAKKVESISDINKFLMKRPLYPDDKVKLNSLLEDMPDHIRMELRFQNYENENYHWFAFSGKVICDTQGNRLKLVGSLRDIQEEKEKQLRKLEETRRDPVTSLYTRNTGTEKIKELRKEIQGGIMVLIDIDSFREMDEKYGFVFGDTILEELGRMILKLGKARMEQDGRNIFAFRFGGDEFLLWFSDYQRKECEAYLEALYQKIADFSGKSGLLLSVTGGAVSASDENLNDLIEKAILAQSHARIHRPGKHLFYSALDENEERESASITGSEIVSVRYTDRLNMVSQTLNFFDKGGPVGVIMNVLLLKLGRYYQASDIFISSLNRDFNTNYLEYQWHSSEYCWNGSKTKRYTDEELQEFLCWIKSSGCFFDETKVPAKMLRTFLLTKPGQSGLAIPFYDNGIYMGSICFTGEEDALFQKEEEKKNLCEIAVIIQNNLNRERHDLASQAKTEFLSRMSHEIRTPLNGIIGMTQIALREGQDGAKAFDCLKKIQSSSDYLLGLINDILDMSKIESGKMKLAVGDFSMKDLLENVTELIANQAAAKNIRFIQHFEYSGEWFVGDRLRISQVLINLLGNAVKFTGTEGEISLSVWDVQRENKTAELYFAVKDNGVGISEKDQERVFHSFEQADGNPMVRSGGTGLGLAISRKLVQMMKGEIKLDSKPGKGSCFYFAIHLPTGEAPVVSQPSEKKFSVKGRTVLIVEDNAINAEIAGALMKSYGFAVEFAENGQKAVERIGHTAPGTYDLILMDIRMPVMDGLEATKVIRSMKREDAAAIPIVAMTANAFDDDMKKSIECGMNGHLAKPVDVRKLEKILEELFGE